ncbi:MAG: DUF3842 family protein [Fusobacteriaceae bacterium]|jgi:NADPH:quinone reductase-like Zn-dependent oxidoreductase|nr:DUF3842 family protein [Fusobacteriaceae bacterium]
MNILVIDGMGGGVGKAIIERLRAAKEDWIITAVGTNTAATSAMLTAGAHQAATGENAVIYNCARADCIIGPMGILLANAMLGEISPGIANAVSASQAKKILVPTTRCNAVVVGTADLPLAKYLDEIPAILRKLDPIFPPGSY